MRTITGGRAAGGADGRTGPAVAAAGARVETGARPPGAGPRSGDLHDLLAAGRLHLPAAVPGSTAARWAELAGWGLRDPATARLVEGHADAVAILAEAGREADPAAVYGVWAARSGGTGAHLRPEADGHVLHGTVRFCSGARSLDRALVVADAPDGAMRLVEVVLADPRVVPDPDSWSASAMAGADTLDVRFDDLPVPAGAVVGEPGWYTARPGFALGGAGVAAVWWGAAAGVLERIAVHLPPEPDPHQLAHLGELHALVRAAQALLERLAAAVDTGGPSGALEVAEVRSAVERVAREVLDRGPRMVGPGPLSRDGDLARALADLALYVRQHHGERDHAALGRLVLDARDPR